MAKLEQMATMAGKAAPAMDAMTGAIDSSAMRNGVCRRTGRRPGAPPA